MARGGRVDSRSRSPRNRGGGRGRRDSRNRGGRGRKQFFLYKFLLKQKIR